MTAPVPRLRQNILALGVVQAASYLLPLITTPYVTRALGADGYGRAAFVQSQLAYFQLLVDYGFSWSATREVAAARADRQRVSALLCATWAAQWVLVLLAAIVLVVLTITIERWRQDALLFAAAFLGVIGSVIGPPWFLQGMERLTDYARMQVACRVLALLPLFALVHDPDDAALYLAINSGATIAIGGWALWWMHRHFDIAWRWPSRSEVWQAFASGAGMFGVRIVVSLYTMLVPVVLGWTVAPAILAHYMLADRLRSAAQGVLSPISQALFPRMSHLAANDPAAAWHLVGRSAGVVIGAGIAVSGGLWIGAAWLVRLFGGAEFAPATEILRWLAPLPLIIGLSNLFAVQIMLPFGLQRRFYGIIMLAALVCVIGLWPMVRWNGAVGAAQLLLIVESLVTVSMGVAVWRWRRGLAHTSAGTAPHAP